MRLRKVPLEPLMDMLLDVYNMGADYIDIIGVHNKRKDFLGIEIEDDYFCDEMEQGVLSKEVLDKLQNL